VIRLTAAPPRSAWKEVGLGGFRALPMIKSLRTPSDRPVRICVGTWLSLVEHSLGVRGVGSSNLPVPTILKSQRYAASLSGRNCKARGKSAQGFSGAYPVLRLGDAPRVNARQGRLDSFVVAGRNELEDLFEEFRR
jgi:hypothetical protein